MIEPAMYLAIGFLLASLLGVILIPLVHNRAVRLTMRRLEASTPLSMAEIQADKDQLRAEFAMSTRRLEMSVEQMKAKTTSQLAEIGKKTDVINRLKVELGDKTSTIFALEAREKALKDQIARHRRGIFGQNLVAARNRAHAVRQGRRIVQARASNSMTNPRPPTARRSNWSRSRRRSKPCATASATTNARSRKPPRGSTASALAAADATSELSNERGRVENLGKRVGQLEQQLVAQIDGRRSARQARNRTWTRALTEQSRLLAERESECDRLRAELDSARASESDLRGKICHVEPEPQGSDREPAVRENAAREGTRARAIGARPPAKRNRLDEARGGSLLGLRTRRERAAARTHQRRRRPDRADDGRARRPEFADRGDPRRRQRGDQGRRAAGRQDPPTPRDTKGNLAERMRALQARASRLPSTT